MARLTEFFDIKEGEVEPGQPVHDFLFCQLLVGYLVAMIGIAIGQNPEELLRLRISKIPEPQTFFAIV